MDGRPARNWGAKGNNKDAEQFSMGEKGEKK
jgi:hypothetical protein